MIDKIYLFIYLQVEDIINKWGLGEEDHKWDNIQVRNKSRSHDDY